MKNRKKLSLIAKRLVKDLEENIYCRLRPSRVHGIGVFAIRDIPKGKNIFKMFSEYELTPVPWDMIKRNLKIHPAVKKLAYDTAPLLGGNLYLYRRGLNAMDISFFLNHSDHPNVVARDSGAFVTTRRIKRGEELFSDHKTYSDDVVIR